MTRGEEEAMINLAGKVAEYRAMRPDSKGWRRWPTLHESTCLHESAHCIVAAALGRHPQWAIVAEPAVTETGVTLSGRAHIGYSPEQGAQTEPSLEGNDRLESDFSKVIAFCQFIAGERGWFRHMRVLWRETDVLLRAHWPAVKILSLALRDKGVVRRQDIEDIMRRWPANRETTSP